MPIRTPICATIILVLALSGCNSDHDDASVDERLATAIARNGLDGDPSQGRSVPGIETAEAQLGMELFYSKALGGNKDSACVSCHHPALAGGDALSLPLGVGADNPDLLGPGRTIGGRPLPNVPRNSPTTFNTAFWDSAVFHDGRVESLNKEPGKNGSAGAIRTPDSGFGTADPQAGPNLLAAQSRFPVTSAEEMRGHSFEKGSGNDAVRDHLAKRLSGAVNELDTPDNDGSGENDWKERFEAVYGPAGQDEQLITYARIASAIGAYESSQVFVDTPWKAYVQGDREALTESQKNGALLFFTPVEEGGAGCSGCHSGDFFTDEQFHNIAMIQVGPGKGDGETGTGDFGRFRETGRESDRYSFRTPTLLNVELTAPYGHAGAYDDLEGVIRHHLNPGNAIDDYFASSGTWCQAMDQFINVMDCDALFPHAERNTRNALQALQTRQAAGKSGLVTTELTDSQVADLVAFMEALTDPCLEDASCLDPWIPDRSTTGASALQLNGVDRNQQPLLSN